jgi:CHAD domain-containing protein
MTDNLQERIGSLQAAALPVDAQDTIAEAGRKVLLANFITMLKHEAGSRTGEDIEDVHDMRVASRRMRSIFLLLEDYFKGKAVRPYERSLRKIARTLGEVRDLDVMISDLTAYKATLEAEQSALLQEVIDELDQQRGKARENLNRVFDQKGYHKFIENFSAFLTSQGDGAKAQDNGVVTPYQVRHVLPMLIHDRLASVRAYDTVLENADDETLHALRVEFKRLRYTVSLFEDVLGSGIKDFVDDLKAIQDHLGRMNDIVVAREFLENVIDDLDDVHAASIQPYLDFLEGEHQQLSTDFPAIWKRFNHKNVQKKLAVAVSAL